MKIEDSKIKNWMTKKDIKKEKNGQEKDNKWTGKGQQMERKRTTN